MAAGCEQKTLVALTGHDKSVISRQLRGYWESGIWESGIPKHVRATIIAWELMTPEQRAEWLRRVEEDGDGSAGPVGADG
ncbi:hypothetical protein FHW79_006052 [Azospirillum sp. OGB3]|nr:hypothetical protein [Azospirillum sp. OGB3]